MATRSSFPTATPTEKKTSYLWWILGAALLAGAILAYNNRRRLAEAMGMSVIPRAQAGQQRSLLPQRIPRRRGGAQVEAVAPVAAPVVAAAPGCDTSMPKPFNVYQDNLSGSNDITVGPGVAFDGAAGVPVDFAGSCSGVNPAAVWQSTQLLPSANCGQSLEGTSDWSTFAPSDPSVVNFLSAGMLAGADTISTTLKNASLDLRSEPAVPSTFQSPWNQSSWVTDAAQRVDYSHSLIA